MQNKIDKRISKIRSERYELLTLVSDNIKNNGKVVFSDIKSIMDIIDYDEKCVKKYEAIVKAQNLVVSLTKEITFANSEDEIKELRKKLNYYINKIKKELKKRNISEEYINKYSESVNYLRKDIAKYIRILKRENNLSRINDIYTNYDLLTEEEKNNLKKLLNTESHYNHRNLYPKETNKIINKEVSKKEESESTDIYQEIINKINGIDSNETTSKEASQKDESDIANVYQEILDQINRKKHTELDYQPEDIESLHAMIPKPKPENRVLRVVRSIEDVKPDDIEYLDLKIKSYDRKYSILALHDYNKSFFQRVGSMIKNIPLYRENKKIIKIMESDSCKYYGGSDLISYIAYLSKINSIKHGLKSVFNKSYLYSEETRLLNDHQKCAEWLLDYCNKNSLGISFLTRTKVIS